MAPPTRSLRLIKRHIRERRISRTTFIVTMYLLANILGRLSVAIFGLAFNLKDVERIVHPTLVTNWASALWTRNIDLFVEVPGAPKGYEVVERKDTTPYTRHYGNELVLTCMKRFLEFGLEWNEELWSGPCAQLGFWKF